MNAFPFAPPRSRLCALLVAVAGVCIAGLASAQALVDIADVPLFGGRSAHPNIVVTASVEFPTVGQAYRGVAYLRSRTYLGYFDPSKCYSYDGGSGGYFYVSGTADANHECVSQFSGNFMNWSTMSAIDEFRFAMTGGNRVSESGPNNGTVLERAYIPDGSISGVPDFTTSGNFPVQYLINGTVNGTPSSNLSALFPVPAASNSTPVYILNCRTLAHYRNSPGGNCLDPAANLPVGLTVTTLNIRVNVCDNTEGPLRRDLCKQYGGSGGRYKPVGQVQVNADRMRFASFGYLMDRSNGGYAVPSGCDDGTGWSRCRYGGVLRSPMKYVGPTTYDAAQLSSPNSRKEVNADGTLNPDPEGTASSAGGSYSGFINFINKFGSNGIVNGLYKRYDPAGEMYYEAIRYYQNLQPTPEAVSGAFNNPVKDYFPVITNWTDPILSSCSANYIINISDANTWDDTYLPGFNSSQRGAGYGRPSSRPATQGLDAYLWTSRIASLESSTPSIASNDVRPNLSSIQNAGTGTGTASYLIAGAAYWANVNDIRADLTGKQTIKTISFDVAEQSITDQDKQLYLMGKYGGFNNTIDRTSDAYPNPFYGSDQANPLGAAIRTNSEWEDSTGSAYPANYLLASDPQKLINGIQAAFARISAQSGTLSGAALTSANLTYGSAGAYIATFDPARWSGSVLYNSLSVDVSGNLVVSNSPIWDSGALLSARCGTVVSGSTVCTEGDTSVNKRKIFTTAQAGRTGLTAGTRVAKPFTLVDITVAADALYLLALNTSPQTNLPDALGQQRINYLRGYRADEASSLGFRQRDSAMGDIVNSGPVYSGPPTSSIPDADYQAFYLASAARAPTVFVGANDGMLHAIRASDGVELFSYVPGFTYADLNDLTNPAYAHEVYVDTVPKVQEAKVGSTWKTILVGAGGAGAQGIFALDVSDPSTFAAGNVLWEFTDADDADFVSVVAQPEFAKIWVSGTGTNKVYRYFAIVTGYNNKRTTVNNRTDSKVSTDSQNKSVLFLIALDHVLGNAWVQGQDYYKFTFPASNPAQPNGLGPVSLIASKTGDRSTASMYFGDLQGNLWKFNTETGSPSSWTPALGTTASPLPIFVAQDASNRRQPITARVELANGPFGSTLVYFGTGEYLGATDLNTPYAQQSEYALLDLNQSVAISRTSDLVQRTGTVSGQNVVVSGPTFSYTGPAAKKGWYLDFPSTGVGERSVTKPAVRTGLLTFTTLTLSNNLCTPGNGYIYQVNALTGLPVAGAGTVIGYSSTVGIPGPPRVVDLTLTAGQGQAAGEQVNLKTQTTLVSGTSSQIKAYGPQTPIKAPPTQQINWREITNWNDLTNH